MKPLKNIYPQIWDFENLYSAYLSAAKGKRFRDEVLRYSSNLEENLIELQNELLYKTYQVGAYTPRYIYERKTRLIMALPFKDRVAQWALYRKINPIFAKAYIADSYGCVQGRGPQQAAKRAQYWIRLLERQSAEKVYYLKLDISKFFYRVDHQILLDILGRKFHDADLMWLFSIIIESEDQPFGLPQGYNPGETDLIFHKGMPIGNLTSQMFANIYMNELDQYAKRDLHIRHYARYMDDIVIFSPCKKDLHEHKRALESFLSESLNLDLNNKTTISPTTLGLEFCGYRIWSTHIKLRKSTTLHMKRRLKSIQTRYASGTIDLDRAKRTVASYKGLLMHCNSYNLRKSIYRDFALKRGPKPEG